MYEYFTIMLYVFMKWTLRNPKNISINIKIYYTFDLKHLSDLPTKLLTISLIKEAKFDLSHSGL